MNTKVHLFISFMSKLAICTMIFCYSLTMAFAGESLAQRKRLVETHVDVRQNHEELLGLIKELEDATDFSFMYTRSDLKGKKISIPKGEWNMERLMKDVSSQSKVSIRRVNEIISIKLVLDNTQNPELYEELISQITVSGRVIDDSGETLPGATVQVKGTSIGTITDVNGLYSIVAEEQDVLVFSFVGFKTMEVPVDSRTEINVELSMDIEALDEVVVVGYGTSKKEELTSSIVQIKSEDFRAGVTNNPVELLKGKVPGLSIINQAGSDPNSTPQVNLRGVGTISANNEPLVIIDGVYGTMPDLYILNPNDIESFNVLKDAASAAIYGTRGSNGVIIVETKFGEREKSQIIYTSSYFIEKPRRNPEMLNAQEYLDVMRTLGFSKESIDKGFDTNWTDELITSKLSSYHSLAISKGTKTSQMRFSLGYRDSKGLILNSSNKTANFRLNFKQQIYKWLEAEGTIGGNRSDQAFANYNALDEALKYDPTAPVYNEDGTFYQLPGVGASNPVALLKQIENGAISNRVNLNVNLTGHITDNLSVSVKGSSFLRNYERSLFEDIDSRNSVLSGIPGRAEKENNSSVENIFEATSNFNQQFGKHNIKLLAGYSLINNVTHGSNMFNRGFLTNKLKYNDIGAGSFLQDGRADFGSFKQSYRLIAFFGRFNYSWSTKYLFNASLRQEGASVFGENNKWGLFPAVSGGWRISQEDFMSDLPFISSLKLRAGYGVTGRSQGIAPYQSLARIGESGRALYNGQWIFTYGPINNPNPDLRWERSKELNIGLDFGVLSEQVTGSVDFYTRITDDLLGSFNTQTPPSLEPVLFTNVGSIKNQGIEFIGTFKAIDGNEFKWDITPTFSINTNEVISLANDQFQADTIYYGDYGNVATSLYMMAEGTAVGTFYGFKFKEIGSDGKWVFKDQNNDGRIDENIDYQVIGNGLPKYFFSLNNQFSWRQFDLSIYMVGAAGYHVFNEKRLWYENTANSPSNYFKSMLDEPQSSLDDRLRFSDYYLEKGNYLRLDNITLGYNLKNVSVFKQARIYTTVTNVALLTNYSGIDPEVGSGTNGGLSFGWDTRSFYPRSATYLLGLNITF